MLGMRALSTNRIIDLTNFVKRIVRIHNNRRSTSTQIKYLIDLIQCKHPPTNKWGKTRCTDSKKINGQLDVTVEVHIYSSRNRFNLVHESTTFNRPLTHYIYTILIWFGKNFNQIQSHHQQPSAQHTNEIPLNSKLIAVINFKFRAQLAHSHSWRSVNTVRQSSQHNWRGIQTNLQIWINFCSREFVFRAGFYPRRNSLNVVCEMSNCHFVWRACGIRVADRKSAGLLGVRVSHSKRQSCSAVVSASASARLDECAGVCAQTRFQTHSIKCHYKH